MIREFLIPDPLNLTGDISKNWETFRKKFDQFMGAAELNTKPEETKLAIFLNIIGKDGLELFKTFKFNYQNEDGTNPTSLTLKTVMDCFKNYCDKKNKVIYNICKFYERKQMPGEDFDSYLKAIVELAKFCDFEVSERMLRDRIVSGVKNSKLREELMLLHDATFKNVVKHCQDFEARNESHEVLNEENIYLFSYKIVKCKELKDGMNHIKSYITMDVKDLAQNTNDIQVNKQDGLKEKHDLLLCHNVKSEQCVPNNSSDEELNISTSSAKADEDAMTDYQDDLTEKDVKLNNALMINPMSELAVKDEVQKEKFKVRWSDIFAACHNSDKDSESTESDSNEEFKEISFVNKCFNSKQNHENTQIKQEVNNNNDKSRKVIYSEILKNRLRKRKINSFKCQNCKQGFYQKSELLLHEKKCRSIKSENLVKGLKKRDRKCKVKKEENDSKNFYVCKECGKTYTIEFYLKRHSMTHAKEKPFKCEVCNRSFTYIFHYKRHLSAQKSKCSLH